MIIWPERGHDEVFADPGLCAFIDQPGRPYRQFAGHRIHCTARPYGRYAIDGFIGCGLGIGAGRAFDPGGRPLAMACADAIAARAARQKSQRRGDGIGRRVDGFGARRCASGR